jgi:hypothetical protein
MTLDEIKNYFLNIGGTFRKSRQWQDKFEDAQGHSMINKSGRFGIGVLAAYLIGDCLQVYTKSFSSETGYYFKSSLNQEQIEIKKHSISEIGTIIKVKISYSIYDHLLDRYSASTYGKGLLNSKKFDKWYFLKTPNVVYDIPSFKQEDDDDKLGNESLIPMTPKTITGVKLKFLTLKRCIGNTSTGSILRNV